MKQHVMPSCASIHRISFIIDGYFKLLTFRANPRQLFFKRRVYNYLFMTFK